MKLATYLIANSRSAEQFAAEVGDCSVSAVIKWMRDERIPRPDQQRRIAKITNGAVMPNDFVLDEVQP